jgi:ATP-dependent protease ClpP protease subunit
MSSQIEEVSKKSNEDPGEMQNELLEFSKQHKAILMSIVAPLVGQKISPTKIQNAHISIMDEFTLETAIEEIKSRTECSKIILLLNSPGGSIQSSYKIACALRNNFKHVTVYVPHIAASGGTLIALAGNKIVMGMMSQLSPLDPIMDLGENQTISAKTVLESNSQLAKVFEFDTQTDVSYINKVLADKYDPIQFAEAKAITNLMSKYIYNVLINSDYVESESKKITNELIFGFLLHEEVINESCAINLGLKIEDSKVLPSEWKIMRNWLKTLLIQNSGIHLIHYYIHSELNSVHCNVSTDLLLSTDSQREHL